MIGAAIANTNYGAAARYCNGQVVHRGTAFESDWRKEVNLTAQIRVPVDFDASVRLDVFNVFNSKAVLEAQEFGDLASGAIDPNYRAPLTYAAPRYARIQFRVGF